MNSSALGRFSRFGALLVASVGGAVLLGWVFKVVLLEGGISPAVAARVFERLYQVAEHRPQQGTTFSFTLPVFALDNMLVEEGAA